MVYLLVVFLSAAVLAWTKSSSSVVAVGTSPLSGSGGVADGTLMIRLMPEALSHLLSTEPWLQIAGKVSET